MQLFKQPLVAPTCIANNFVNFYMCLLVATDNMHHLAEHLFPERIEKEIGIICHIQVRPEPPLIDMHGRRTHVVEFFCTVITILDHITQNKSDGGVLVGARKSADSFNFISSETSGSITGELHAMHS
jgi:hypothetical protein